ncbi:TetR family transcriptional regulator [Microbacterium sp. B2969]|uniref:TetR family transcriptional regulator n=1 Tax=Microbacterium alkaliflavum TaxID=3248839 RepID=A0ABW7Q5M8_9MICO
MAGTEKTRSALLRAALELFAERGFEATTAAAIAQRAGVTEMTFFRYFPTKDSVLVDDPYDPVIGEAIARQGADLGPLAAAAAGVLEAWRSLPEPDAAAVRERLRIVAQTPSLRAALARNSLATEEAIGDALRARGTDRVRAAVAASATVAALNAALLAWAVDETATLGDAIGIATSTLRGADA